MSDATADQDQNDDDVELKDWLSRPSRRLLNQVWEEDTDDVARDQDEQPR